MANSTVLLGTAIVCVRNKASNYDDVRVLVDSGSPNSVITIECAARLGLARRKCWTEIVGSRQIHVKVGERQCYVLICTTSCIQSKLQVSRFDCP